MKKICIFLTGSFYVTSAFHSLLLLIDGCILLSTNFLLIQASIVGYKYGVLRWSKTGSK